jgi:predicted SprT family Zn-dependent metalloprotease
MSIYKNYKKKLSGAVFMDDSENINLKNSIFDENYRNELKEMSKHEIIIKICEIIGSCPANIKKAENIFELIKFEIANYIIHHEYNAPHGISADLLIWLDSRINPRKAKKLSTFFDKYIKE